ncbi:MAG TPA: hypothetical protein VI757_07535 [Bacteroidia bacterium]|nr:hypothetical protein [Bacteroidia bacterium]
MTKKIIFSAACTLLAVSALAQHTIVLKSGEKINGVIASMKDGYINYTSKNQPKEIKITEVSAVYFDLQAVPVSPATEIKSSVAPKESGEKTVSYQMYTIRYKVADRTIIKPPKIDNLTEQKGTVVVNITVDKYGHVVKAVPGAEGSTTKSDYLYTKARQAAESAQFDSAPTSPLEAKGYMIIRF